MTSFCRRSTVFLCRSLASCSHFVQRMCCAKVCVILWFASGLFTRWYKLALEVCMSKSECTVHATVSLKSCSPCIK